MKHLIAMIAIAASLAFTGVAWPRTSSSAHINISIRVDKFAEWADESPVIVETDWPGTVNKVNQSRTVSKSVVLYTNTDTTVTAKPGLNNGVLSNGADKLHTAYRVTGSVANPDSAFKDAGTFFSSQNAYTVIHEKEKGSYPINLEVQATSPASGAPEEGLYTCGLTLTAAW